MSTDNTPDIFGQTTCLLLRFHKTSLTRKGDVSKIQSKADKTKLGLRKKILTSDNYDQMMVILRDCRRYVKQRQIPSPFAEGTHLIPLTLVSDVDEKIENARQAYERFADAFVAEYPQLVAEAEAALEDQFDPANYYDVSDDVQRRRLRSLFWVEFRYFDFGPPSSGKVGAAISRREIEKQKREVVELAENVKAALRVGLKKLIDHLVDRLTPSPDGKRKQFAATTVEKVTEFLDLLESRNIVKDVRLAELAAQAAAIMRGQSAEVLKKDENLAAYVVSKMSEVQANLSSLVEEMPDRALALEDDDE